MSWWSPRAQAGDSKDFPCERRPVGPFEVRRFFCGQEIWLRPEHVDDFDRAYGAMREAEDNAGGVED